MRRRGGLKSLPVLCLAGATLVLFSAAGLCFGEDMTAPDFTLTNLDGKSVTLSELLTQGPVIIDFWATWCKPCIKGFPGLQDLLNKYKDRGLTVLAISVDGPKSRSRVGPFIRSKKYSFEVLLDTEGRVAKKYNTVMIPRTVLVNSDRKIEYASVGYSPSNHQQIEKALLPLLPKAGAGGGEVVE